jgi:hypothetical protein
LSRFMEGRHAGPIVSKERQLRRLTRRWTLYCILGAFLVGPGLCVVADLDDNHYGAGSAPTAAEAALACGTSAVPCESQSGPNGLLRLASPLILQETSFNEAVWLSPPTPPPRS